jgi:hypothetical protein
MHLHFYCLPVLGRLVRLMYASSMAKQVQHAQVGFDGWDNMVLILHHLKALTPFTQQNCMTASKSSKGTNQM